MSVTLQRTCDFLRDGGRCGREASASADARLIETRLYADLCNECVDRMAQGLTDLGLTPTKAVVGHSYRNAYVTASGQPFTTAEARAWLREAGVPVAAVGKLTKEQLALYAAAH